MPNTLRDFPPSCDFNYRKYRSESLQAMQEITRARLNELRAHVEAGGRFVTDLGSGDGAFPAAISRSRQQWVLGIEPQADKLLFESGSMGILGYQKAGKFVMLNLWYGQVLEQLHRELSWLAGGALKAYMIMPNPDRSFTEEITLWLKMGAPQSELHVLTEDGGLARKFQFPRPVELIPFDEAARHIPSSFAINYLGKSYEPLLAFGFRQST